MCVRACVLDSIHRARYYLQQYEDVIADVNKGMLNDFVSCTALPRLIACTCVPNDSGLPKEMLDLVLSKGRENHLMVSEYNRNGPVEVTDRQGASELRCDSLPPLVLMVCSA